MNGLGLLACLPSLWYAALALAVLGPCLLLGVRPMRVWAMVLGLGTLILVLYGTTSAVYPVPRIYSTYKHVAVVEHFLAGHPVDRSLDIYQNWPGFFLAAAYLHRLTGVEVLTLAQWSEPFFAALVALCVVWATRGALPRPTRDDADGRPAPEGTREAVRQISWAAALLVTAANWVGQNYFSPQAAAFPLALLVIGMLLRMVPRPMGEHLRIRLEGRRLRRVPPVVPRPRDGDNPWAPGRAAPAAVPGFWGSWAGPLVCLLTFTAVVVSHQLSPVIVLAQAVGLAVVFRMRHAWLPAAFVVVEVAWIAQAWGYLSRRFRLFDLQGVENFRPPSTGPAASLPYAQTLAWGSPALMLLLMLLTLVAVLRLATRLDDRPEQRWVVAPVLFGLAPIGVIVVQPYGNEGIFRAFLFALPWSAMLIARGVLLSAATWRPGRGWWRYVLPPLLVALWLPTSFGLELDNYVYASDVRTVRWAADHTPPGAAFLRVTGGSPMPATGDYGQRRFEWELLNQPLTVWPDYATAADAGADALVRFTAQSASWFPVADVYLFLGPGQAAHVRYFGDLGAVGWPEFEAAIAASGRFELVHRDGRSTVWHYLGRTTSSA